MLFGSGRARAMLFSRKDRSIAMDAVGTRIQGFDGLRAIAFVLVFLSHKITFFNANGYGDVGVWLFFVLSGFLITRILAASRDEIEAGRTTVLRSLRRFYIRRSARIFPPYYLLLAVVLVVSLFVPIYGFWRAEKLAFATYTTNIMIGHYDYWPGQFGHLWTLAIEEQFYILFAPLALLVPRRHTLALCVAILLIAVAWRINLRLANATPTAQDVSSLVNFGLLALGGIVGLNAHRKLQSWLTTGTAQLVALSLIAVSPALFFDPNGAWALYAKACIGPVAGLLLLQVMQGQESWFVGVLKKAPLRDLGRISYGTYLVHNLIVLGPLMSFFGLDAKSFGMPWIAATLAEFVITIAIAALSWRFMEKPIMAWAARVTMREPAAMERAPAQELQSKA